MPITKYENQTFEKKAFVIEECFFVNCVVRDCDVFYSGGDFEWENVQWDQCRFHFRGPALKTLQLFQTMGMLKPGQTPIPPPTKTSSHVN